MFKIRAQLDAGSVRTVACFSKMKNQKQISACYIVVQKTFNKIFLPPFVHREVIRSPLFVRVEQPTSMSKYRKNRKETRIRRGLLKNDLTLMHLDVDHKPFQIDAFPCKRIIIIQGISYHYILQLLPQLGNFC
jgi:hypothetical protein